MLFKFRPSLTVLGERVVPDATNPAPDLTTPDANASVPPAPPTPIPLDNPTLPPGPYTPFPSVILNEINDLYDKLNVLMGQITNAGRELDGLYKLRDQVTAAIAGANNPAVKQVLIDQLNDLDASIKAAEKKLDDLMALYGRLANEYNDLVSVYLTLPGTSTADLPRFPQHGADLPSTVLPSGKVRDRYYREVPATGGTVV